mmetsp:Transcript_84071/g.232969  ORF Transcript_84071/g.232969 Transcript_84071/m.232969 type:complete len:238 (-) Transcript_84071:172-885(-)
MAPNPCQGEMLRDLIPPQARCGTPPSGLKSAGRLFARERLRRARVAALTPSEGDHHLPGRCRDPVVVGPSLALVVEHLEQAVVELWFAAEPCFEAVPAGAVGRALALPHGRARDAARHLEPRRYAREAGAAAAAERQGVEKDPDIGRAEVLVELEAVCVVPRAPQVHQAAPEHLEGLCPDAGGAAAVEAAEDGDLHRALLPVEAGPLQGEQRASGLVVAVLQKDPRESLQLWDELQA